MEIKNVLFEFSRITESAAIAAYKYIGFIDKNKADQAAVSAMRLMLNELEIDGRIVIGEGSLDEAPELYRGEKLGVGGLELDIAVDPVDGTANLAYGRANAISVIAAAKRGCILSAPDMYMLKLACGEEASDVIDIDLSLEENIRRTAKALDKDISEVGVAMLERARNSAFAKTVSELGARVFYFTDGDIASAIQTCMPDSDIDLLYGIGGAPEGAVAAVALKSLGGNIQGKLIHYDEIWPDEDTAEIVKNEKKTLIEQNLKVHHKLTIDDFVSGEDFLFSATGITKSDLLEGIVNRGNLMQTQTLLIRGKTQTVRKINSYHSLNKKNKKLKEIFFKE